MKIFISFVLTILLVAVVFTVCMGKEARRHEVALAETVPFSIGEEFPQYPENGAFGFQLMGGGQKGKATYFVVAGIGLQDPSYYVLFMFMTLDGERFHVVGAGSGHVVRGKITNQRHYRDEGFFMRRKFTGHLQSTPSFPSPEEVEGLLKGVEI